MLMLSCCQHQLSGATLLTEDFDTDGEGTRYTSSAFDDGISDFFERQTVNPDPRHATGSGFVFTSPQSGAYWSSEDIDDGAPSNPLGDHGIVRLNDLAVSGFTNLEISVFFAQVDDRFDLNDKRICRYIVICYCNGSGKASFFLGTYPYG